MQHATLKQLVDIGCLTIAEISSLFKFAFVRNPWDRAVSNWLWLVQGDNYQNQFRKVFTRIGNIESLEQMTGRVHTDILGELVHCWLYQREIIKPDMANHRALLISMDDESSNLWSLVKTICPVPLLDHWQNQLIPELYNSGMIKNLNGINQTGKQIVIDEDQMALIVKNGCMDGSLTVHTADNS